MTKRDTKVCLVIPTIRNLDFLKSWENEFSSVSIIVVEDNPEITIKVPKGGHKELYHYSWKEIDKDLGTKSWIIPRRTSAIRSYGFYKAFQMGATHIITIDDDVYPQDEDFVNKHINNLETKIPDRWFPTNPFSNFWYTRGFPYFKTRNVNEVVVSHGMWTENLDLDAPTHLLNMDYRAQHNDPFNYFIPQNYYFPLCIMNVAFKRSVAPLFYMLLMGKDKNMKDFGFERFDDIWAGILMKKILDHLNLGVISGSPIIRHDKASNPFDNLAKESKGIKYNEMFWKLVDEVRLTKTNVNACYKELIQKIKFPDEEYFKLLKKSIFEWLELFG